MRIDIVSLFPEISRAPLQESMMKRAQEAGQVEIHCHDLREWASDKHRKTDDEPFGGGQGMVLKPEPLFACVRALESEQAHVVLMTPQGPRFDQKRAIALAKEQTHLLLLCGHYEGVDHRVVEALVDEELSIGDYVLTNGALAAAVVTDAVVRLLPGVLGDERSAWEESFSEGILESPQYTRPADYEGRKIPEVLLSGHHEKIAAWRREQALQRTRENRPDLLGEQE
ncbi:MAG: tRNA (guanosine(37)-N1)-methyltransferase TrmD [Verrucomicrobiota bacterium]